MSDDKMHEDAAKELRLIKSGSDCVRDGQGRGTWDADEEGTIIGRAVPYGKVTMLAPGLYETFTKGSFAAAAKDPARTRIKLEHTSVIGRAVALEERDDGLWVRGKITLHPDIPEARKALALVREGLIDQMSIGFRSPRGGYSVRPYMDGNIVTHTRAGLPEVSVVPTGQYADAVIESIRDDTAGLAERLRIEREWWRSLTQ